MATECPDPKDHDGLVDIRGLVTFALFVLSGALLLMIYLDPGLLKEGAFMLLVGMVIGQGGLGAVTGWLFGGTKTGGEVMKSNAEAVIAAAPTLPPGSTTVTTSTSPAEPTT